MATLLIFFGIVFLNVRAYKMYAQDKWAALNYEERIPEDTLLLWSAAGGFGALAGIHYLNHKTNKAPFRMAAIASAAIETAIVLFL